MKNRRNRFLPQAANRRLAQGRLPFAERMARHLRWSAAILSPFYRADGLPGWRPTKFTFGLRAKLVLSLMRRVLNLRLSWPRLEQTAAVTNSFLAQPLLVVRDSRSLASRDPGPRSLAPNGAPLLFRPSHLDPAFSQLEKLYEHHIWLQRPASATPLSFAPSPTTVSLGARPKTIPQKVSAPEMTTRIVRRLRRVEEGRLSPEPRLVVSPSSAHGFADNFEAAARRLQGDASPVHHSELGASIPIPSGISVTRLTDEVMRQIDRRLVAARERMGKI